MYLIVAFVVSSYLNGYSQHFKTDTIGAKTVSDNLYNKPLFGDSLASSFVIVIKKEVKLHKHLLHSEHVVVLEGSGQMTLGSKSFAIKKGDVVFIPKNTLHGVISMGEQPLKVLSVQAPKFDGKDRVFID